VKFRKNISIFFFFVIWLPRAGAESSRGDWQKFELEASEAEQNFCPRQAHDLGDKSACRYYLERSLGPVDQARFQRRNTKAESSELAIKTRGRDVILRDDLNEGESFVVHNYFGYSSRLSSHLVKVSLYEDTRYLLISDYGGEEEIVGPPVISPNNKWFVVTHFGGEYHSGTDVV
jgi:hypothetical protein